MASGQVVSRLRRAYEILQRLTIWDMMNVELLKSQKLKHNNGEWPSGVSLEASIRNSTATYHLRYDECRIVEKSKINSNNFGTWPSGVSRQRAKNSDLPFGVR